MNSRERFLFRQSRGARVRQQILSVLGVVANLLVFVLFFWIVWLGDGAALGDWPSTRRQWKWVLIIVGGGVLLIVVLYQLFPDAMSSHR